MRVASEMSCSKLTLVISIIDVLGHLRGLNDRISMFPCVKCIDHGSNVTLRGFELEKGDNG
jgi:hypothetical protein